VLSNIVLIAEASCKRIQCINSVKGRKHGSGIDSARAQTPVAQSVGLHTRRKL